MAIFGRLILAAAATAAVLCVAVPANASQYGDAPWCAMMNEGNGEVVWDCEYQTNEECVPHVIAGNRGFCNMNPYYRGPIAAAAPRPLHRHHHHHHYRHYRRH